MKKNSNYMIFILLFYVIVAFMAFAFLNGDYSVFNRKASVANQSPMSETVVGNTEENTAAQEDTMEEVIEEEPVDEPAELLEDEPAEEDVTEEEDDPPVAEETIEEVVIEEEDETEQKVYYSFKTNHTQRRLRLRDEPSLSGNVITMLNMNSTGYVLEYDEEWCKVVTGKDTVGYCATEYLDLTEIEESEFPKEFVDQVTTTKIDTLSGEDLSGDSSEPELKESTDESDVIEEDSEEGVYTDEENLLDESDSSEEVLTDDLSDTTADEDEYN